MAPSGILDSMKTKLLDEEWKVLASLLPEGWQALAREQGAIRRARGEVRTPETLLRLLLLHVATGLSLKQAAMRAQVQGLASLTDVALHKRLKTSGDWLCELSRRMFETSRFAHTITSPEGRRLRAVDATTVEEPGATGTDWRVHYSVCLPDLACDFYEVTDVKGGETYTRIPVARGDIILGDRGYSHRKGVAHVLQSGGDAIVRLSSRGFPLLTANQDRRFPLLSRLRTLKQGRCREWAVRFTHEEDHFPARLCAVRKSKAAADATKRKINKEAARKGKRVLPNTLEFANFVFVLTTLDRQVLGTRQVLDLYRARWQVELCFKRLKSLLQLGQLPKKSDASARAWIQGKMLTVMLIERLLTEARLFSPWGFDLAAAESMA